MTTPTTRTSMSILDLSSSVGGPSQLMERPTRLVLLSSMRTFLRTEVDDGTEQKVPPHYHDRNGKPIPPRRSYTDSQSKTVSSVNHIPLTLIYVVAPIV